ncbi:MAG: TonB-dependent receptor [Bacteroidales bacterium]|nr:TonB-dependent receptor [Bacteroidales bacterium]
MKKNKFFKTWMLCMVMLLVGSSVFAQSRTISGTVRDQQGEPVPFASVAIPGSTTGATTDMDGRFTLNVPQGATQFRVSFIGYTPKLVDIDGNTTFTVVLESEVSQLDEIVVVGYGAVRRRDLTGAVASVTGGDLQANPVSDVTQALQGRLPGVNVMIQDGRPGADVNIRVRGGTSISRNPGVETGPLILIDGVPGSLSDIPAAIIQSIDVLKDASSTAIYGARGANGVILVTTIKPEVGTMRVTYGGFVSWNTPTAYFEGFEPYDYLVDRWGVFRAEPTATDNAFVQVFGLDNGGINRYKNVKAFDVQRDLYNTSVSHNHDFTIRGGGERTRAMFTLGYNDDEGMRVNSSSKRLTTTLTVDHKVNDAVSFNFNARYMQREGLGSGFGSMATAYRFLPIDAKDVPGNLAHLLNASDNTGTLFSVFNPAALANDVYNFSQTRSIRGTGSFTWTPALVKGLSFRSEFTMTRMFRHNEAWSGALSAGFAEFNDDYTEITGVRHSGNITNFEKWERWNLQWTNVLNYVVDINKNNSLTLTAGQEVTNSGGSGLQISATRFPSNYTKENAFYMINNYEEEEGGVMNQGTTYFIPNRVLSFFGRANYSLLDRYLLTFTMRADGSSNFAPANRWGYFPAAAVAWRVTEEPFMKDLDLSWLGSFKARFSYGEVGSDAVAPGMWEQTWRSAAGTGNSPNNPYGVVNGVVIPSYTLTSTQDMANPFLKWETTVTRNLGFDFEVLNNRLWGTLDLYKNSTRDLIVNISIPGITGFSKTFANVGEISNTGIELSLNGQIFRNKDWNITAGFNINFNRNRIEKLADGVQSYYGSGLFGGNVTLNDWGLAVGDPVGIVMGFKMAGRGFYEVDDFDYINGQYVLKTGVKDDMSGIRSFSELAVEGQLAFPGAPKFEVDENGRPIRQKIGNMNPKSTGGFNFNVRYKAFDLAMFWNWSYGNQVYNANKLTSLHSGNLRGSLYNNKFAFSKNAFQQYEIGSDGMIRLLSDPTELANANKNATMPSMYISESGYIADIGIEDGSFLRLGTLTVGYTVPRAVLSKVKINNVRIYGTINNVFTLTGYTGMNVEANSQANASASGVNAHNFPTFGMDWNAYPRPRMFVLGCNITF